MKQIHDFSKGQITGNGARGGLTVFTAVLVLILMTLLMMYATRTSLFETRVSGNELRQKQAFHVAEAAVDQGVMFLLSNASLVLSSQVDKFPDGTAYTRDGWFAAGNVRWQSCPLTPADSHPCGGDVAATAGSFFYDTDGDVSTIEAIPVNTTDFPAGTTARMSALLCFIDFANPANPCSTTPPATSDEETSASMVLTLLAYGYSDCTDVNDISTCTGEATVAQPVSNFRNLEGSPAVPLVSKTTFPPSGTMEVVGNPNGGGVGVPLTSWLNSNAACPPSEPIVTSGTWQTCEFQEWYHIPEYPEGVTCTDNNCLCGPGGNDPEYFLSGVGFSEPQCSGIFIGGDTCVSLDIIIDPLFPCDLFEFYFGVPDTQYQFIKNQAQIMEDCTGLGPQSSGLIWISGPDCNINANLSVGSPENPVILISAATSTKVNGGAKIYGIFYLFDGEDPAARLESLGGATVYGSCIVDATLDKMLGNFQIVYAEGVLADARGVGGIGAVNGGWRDFGLPEIAWPVIASP